MSLISEPIRPSLRKLVRCCEDADHLAQRNAMPVTWTHPRCQAVPRLAEIVAGRKNRLERRTGLADPCLSLHRIVVAAIGIAVAPE